MEFVQERIATLHDLGESGPAGGADADLERAIRRTVVVVPMTDREYESPAANRVLSELESLDLAAVLVPVRAAAGRIDSVCEWLESFSLPLWPLWCNSPAVDGLLESAGLSGERGKGRDVWLALGPAADLGEWIVVHDADARSYDADHVRRLLAPLTMGYEFSKGYYARVEEGRLYGRLFRLLYEPLVAALSAAQDAPILEYLGAFRYALAGEFAASASLARRLRSPRSWGLEVGTLGDAFDHAGFSGTAQVDLGRHVHDHRVIAGDAGLEGMSRAVATALLRVVEERGVDPAYETLPDRYRAAGERLLAQYRADAAFNGLEFDESDERDQLSRYADAIGRPAPDRRLPRWTDVPLAPDAVLDAGRRQSGEE
ncbi:glycosyl transferase family 2 [Natrarchaeobius chitinivorans]|uniref:Glycosyl transferase family 2 n=1 Tax=Natrarchaeobius chitinivorans TaxID=1679083 RepID=A0A3N6MT79_NATCH|nr:glycosyl transferase family 2 [Natrarchaeobius chitinivorans]RQG97996.1 glycosyl transferase family 2 [Natrarchaeobius chitinivorans]